MRAVIARSGAVLGLDPRKQSPAGMGLLPIAFAMVAMTILMLLAATGGARAVSDPREMLANPVLEHRAEALGEQLRCLVCQNESIEQSDADLAKDLRRIIRQHIAAGESDQQVMQWMVARYGEFVRLSPPLNAMTLVLWGAPAIAVAIGAGAAFAARRRATVPPPPLSPAERQNLDALLHR